MGYSDTPSRFIYTDLDSLYDTKLTLLNMIDSRLAIEYVYREYDLTDQILYLNNDVFNSIYKDRDKRVLLGSKQTSVIDLIRQIVSDIDIKSKLNNIIRGELKLVINIYPYILNNDECNNIKEFLMKYILHLNEVIIIDKKEIPNDLLHKLNIMIRRDGLDWFFNNKLKTPGFSIPNLKMIVPDSMYEKYIKNTDIDRDKLKEYLETISMQDITLEFIEEELFKFKLDDTIKVE